MTGVLRMLVWLLPPSRAKNALLRALGHRVHPTARVGINLLLGVGAVEVGAASFVGHGNVFRGLRSIRIGREVIVGQFNWITVAPSLTSVAQARMELGDHTVLTNRHYVDCSGGLLCDPYSTIGGVRSVVLSHSVDLGSGKQTLAPVVMKRHAFVATCCTVLPGVVLNERAVLAAGAVTVPGATYDAETLYGGVPAKPIGAIDGGYFHRTRTWIGL
ncbi:hypothetical protein [Actinosynnema sp. NPDC020468]|uniref:acyltransferase n=1 Tax=Actinosynnema sp. NPDC020468 TaxID=3154488 RepID=UPI0033E00BCB